MSFNLYKLTALKIPLFMILKAKYTIFDPQK